MTNTSPPDTEWPSVQHFRDFVVSPALREQGAKMAGYIEGSTNLKLFQTSGGSDDISALFGIDNVVFEYLAFKPKDPSDAGVQSVLQLLQPRLAQIGTAKTAIGSTSNLETREIGVVSVYASDAVSTFRGLDSAINIPIILHLPPSVSLFI